MDHPAKTLMSESVTFYPPDYADHPHAAVVIKVYADDPHKADLAYYCPHDHTWKEFQGATFGAKDGGGYYVNPS